MTPYYLYLYFFQRVIIFIDKDTGKRKHQMIFITKPTLLLFYFSFFFDRLTLCNSANCLNLFPFNGEKIVGMKSYVCYSLRI